MAQETNRLRNETLASTKRSLGVLGEVSGEVECVQTHLSGTGNVYLTV